MTPAARVAEALGGGLVSADEGLRQACARDCWPQALAWDAAELASATPSAVARPTTTAEVASTLRRAYASGVPVVPRGGGSGVLGAAVPRAGSLALDLTGLCSEFEVRAGSEPTARVSAGWLGGALERRLRTEGLALRHVPASLEISTVGGWIAGAGSGQLATLYGGIGAQLVAATVLAPDGSAAEVPADALVGSEGTLGVITEAVLRVRRAPYRRAGWGADCPGLAAALELGERCRRAGAAVVRAYSPVDALVSGLRKSRSGGPHGPGREAAERALLRAHRLLSAASCLLGGEWQVVAVWEDADPLPEPRGASPSPAERWWEKRFQWDDGRLRRMFAGGAFADTLDIWAPYDRLPAVDAAIREACAPYCLTMAHASHLDGTGACLYVTMAAAAGSPEATRALHAAAWKAGLDAAVAAGARATHHHGVGLGKKPWLARAVDPAWLAEVTRLRARLDPRGLMNPGKLCP